MELLNIKGTAKTPSVFLDANKGLVELKGRSIPENTIEFYNPVFRWLDGYALMKKDKTTVNVQLEYFNTSSSKCITEIFKKLEEIARNGSDVIINWHYHPDDEDILTAGDDIKSLIKLPFNFIEL
jgi:hypothetical protein